MQYLKSTTFYHNALHLTRLHCAAYYQSASRHEQHADVTPSSRSWCNISNASASVSSGFPNTRKWWKHEAVGRVLSSVFTCHKHWMIFSHQFISFSPQLELFRYKGRHVESTQSSCMSCPADPPGPPRTKGEKGSRGRRGQRGRNGNKGDQEIMGSPGRCGKQGIMGLEE